MVTLAVLLAPTLAASETCLTCHTSIEPIHPPVAGAPLSCTSCHGGDPSASTTASLAHVGVAPDPGDLRVAPRACGGCHGEIVERVTRSIMTSAAGIISGTLWMNGGQVDREARFTTTPFPLSADDSQDSFLPGQLAHLAPLPTSAEIEAALDSGHAPPEILEAFTKDGCFRGETILVELLRKDCLKCHTNGPSPQQLGDYRGVGCTSCHVVYDDDGLSHSADPTIPKDEPGHPVKHVMTAKVPDRQCETCHQRGSRVSMNYRGLMEQTTHEYSLDLLHGTSFKPMPKDVHHEAGLACIDCHTEAEVHGDGMLYGKRSQQLEVRCESCHGTPRAPATLRTARDRPLTNLRREANGEIVLTGKLDGREHRVTELAALASSGRLPHSMAISGHVETMECYACHSTWVPTCFGCHLQADHAQASQDWITGKATPIGFRISGGYKSTSRLLLGINTRGKIAPMTPGGQMFLTELHRPDGNGVTYRPPVTASGLRGISHNPIVPHTVRRKAQDCATCHENPATWGEGLPRSPLDGWVPHDVALERNVDENLRPVGDVVENGIRALTPEEIERIRSVKIGPGGGGADGYVAATRQAPDLGKWGP